jgi:hypothetical protein
MVGVELQFRVPQTAGLSLIKVDSGAGGGGDMTQLSLGASCFLQLSVLAETSEKETLHSPSKYSFHTT